MDAKKFASENAVLIVAVFALFSLFASSVNISKIWGAPGQTFTLFEFLGVLPAAFLGPVLGIAAILAAKVAQIVFLNSPLDAATLLRLLPPIFAAYFFATYRSNGKHSRLVQIAVPLACMALFVAHPVGGAAWQYSLFWLIPPAIALIPTTHLFLRSLGATFTQHAIGGVVWIYFVNSLNPAAWLALIPIVIGERLLFAAGISFSFVALNAAISRIGFLAQSKFMEVSPLPFTAKKN